MLNNRICRKNFITIYYKFNVFTFHTKTEIKSLIEKFYFKL